MKQRLQGFICGFLIAVSCIGAAAAGTTLRASEFNTTTLFFNGSQIDLSGQNMINVWKDEEPYPRNYMPVRTVLECMGYGVAWDGAEQSVLVMSKDFLEESEDYIDYAALQTIMDLDPRAAHRITYDEERNTVHVWFDAKYHWDIPTAVIGESIYVQKEAVNHILTLVGLPLYEQYTPQHLETLRQEKAQIVILQDVWNILDTQQEDPSQGLWVNFDSSAQIFIVTFDMVQIGTIERAGYDKDPYMEYMKKEDMNRYLTEFGFPVFE